MSIIFGPVNSRRFGKSLGVDLSPDAKQCNFDCLYCELDGAKTVDHYDDVVPLREVIKAIKEALEEQSDIDFITLTANGEPTLYPYLDELVDAINAFKGETKTLILSNSSTIDNPSIQKTLSKIDVVKLSLDCVTQKCFQKLDRAHSGITVEHIKEGMLMFKEHYEGKLIIEILFVKNINDRDIDYYSKFLKKLNPTRIDIGTVDRPPAYDVEALSYEELLALAQQFESTLPIYIASRKNITVNPSNYCDEAILNTLHKRPLSVDDIRVLFDEESQMRLEQLEAANKIEKVAKNGIFFYKIVKSS